MNSNVIATKYLKLIFIIVLAWVGYSIYKADPHIPFVNDKNSGSVAKPLSKSDLQKQKQTQERIKGLESYLSATLQDLKTLEASSSIDITEDLYLDELYLEDLRNK